LRAGLTGSSSDKRLEEHEEKKKKNDKNVNSTQFSDTIFKPPDGSFAKNVGEEVIELVETKYHAFPNKNSL
jgi:hypothetical protein